MRAFPESRWRVKGGRGQVKWGSWPQRPLQSFDLGGEESGTREMTEWKVQFIGISARYPGTRAFRISRGIPTKGGLRERGAKVVKPVP